jgi:hypothetical protein
MYTLSSHACRSVSAASIGEGTWFGSMRGRRPAKRGSGSALDIQQERDNDLGNRAQQYAEVVGYGSASAHDIQLSPAHENPLRPEIVWPDPLGQT